MTSTAPTSDPVSTTAPAPGPGLGRVAALLVLSAPVGLLLSELVAPRETSDLSEAQDLAFLLDNSARLTASWLLGLVVAGLLATAYVLVVSRIRGRGAGVGRVAGVLGVSGAIGLAGHYAISLASLDVAQHGAAASTVGAMEDGTGAVATLLPLIIGANLAIICLAVAATRAGWTHWWVVVAGVLALVADFSPTSWNTALHAVLATAVFGAVVAGLRSPRS